jgi:hypothetical protein
MLFIINYTSLASCDKRIQRCKITTCDPVHSLLVEVSGGNSDAGTFSGMIGYFKIAMATSCPRLTVLSVINKELHASVRKDWIRMMCTNIFTPAVFVPLNIHRYI